MAGNVDGVNGTLKIDLHCRIIWSRRRVQGVRFQVEQEFLIDDARVCEDKVQPVAAR